MENLSMKLRQGVNAELIRFNEEGTVHARWGVATMHPETFGRLIMERGWRSFRTDPDLGLMYTEGCQMALDDTVAPGEIVVRFGEAP